MQPQVKAAPPTPSSTGGLEASGTETHSEHCLHLEAQELPSYPRVSQSSALCGSHVKWVCVGQGHSPDERGS